MGELVFYFGAMGAGKSEGLLRQASGYHLSGKKVLLLTAQPNCTQIESRNGMKIDAKCFESCSESDLRDVDAIFVDEAQFLTKPQVHHLAIIDTDVFCWGLRTDFQGDLFEGAAALLAHADTVMQIPSWCEHDGCNAKATYNLRVDSSGNPVRTGEQVAIRDESTQYRAVCRKHWLDGDQHD